MMQFLNSTFESNHIEFILWLRPLQNDLKVLIVLLDLGNRLLDVLVIVCGTIKEHLEACDDFLEKEARGEW